MTEYVVTLRIAGNSTGAKDALKVVDTELKQVQGQLKETEAQSQKTAVGINKAGVAIGAAIAATAVAMTTMIAKSITLADETGKTAARFGTSAEALSGWRAAAEMAGASSTALDAGLKGLSTSITAAAGGQKKFSQVFDDMGIAVRGASGEVRDLEALLPEIASKFREYKDGPAEAALATKIFGAAGIELLPFLNEGAAGIDELRARAEELGVVLATKTTQEAAAFKDNLGELKVAGIGLFNSIAKDVLPILRDLSDMFVDSAVNALDGAKKTSYIAEALWFVVGAAIIAKNALEMLANIISGVLSGAFTKVKSAYDTARDLTSGVLESMIELGKGEGKRAVDAWRDGAIQAAKTWEKGSVDTQKELDEMRLNLTNNMEDMAKAFALGANPAIDEFTKKIEGTEPPVVDYTRNAKEATTATLALSASLRDMPTAEVADFEQTLVPFMLDVQEGSDAAGESYVEFADTVGYQSNIVGDAIGQMIDAAIYDWENFGEAFKDIAKRFLSDVARMFINQNFQVGGTSGTSGFFSTSTLSSGQAMMAGAGAGIGMSMVGSTNPVMSAGGGALAGMSYGAMIGSVVPVIGTVIGAVIGGIVGLIGGYLATAEIPALNVIGDDVVGTSGYRNLAPGSSYESRLGGFTFASIDEVDRQTRDQIGGAITDFDNTIASFLDDEQLARVTEALSTFNLHLEEGAITAENIIGQRWEAILSTFPEDIQTVVRGAGDLADQVQKLGEVLQFPKLIEDMLSAFKENDLLAGMTEMERATYAVNKQFDEAKEALIAMGATEAQLAEIETYRANALERLAQLQRDQLDDLLDPLRFDELTEGMTETEREIARINKYFDDLYDQAVALGASEEDLALIRRRQTAAIRDVTEAIEDQVEVLATLPDIYQPMEQFPDVLDDWMRAAREVNDFLTGERYASTSTLTPEQMLRAAQGDFNALLQRAQMGDLNAASGLSSAAQRLLELGRGYYASGDEYDALRSSVLGSLTPFGNLATNPQAQLSDAMNALRSGFVQFAQYLQEYMSRNSPPGQAANAASASPEVVELRAVREELRALKAAVSAQGDKQVSAIRETKGRFG